MNEYVNMEQVFFISFLAFGFIGIGLSFLVILTLRKWSYWRRLDEDLDGGKSVEEDDNRF